MPNCCMVEVRCIARPRAGLVVAPLNYRYMQFGPTGKTDRATLKQMAAGRMGKAGS